MVPTSTPVAPPGCHWWATHLNHTVPMQCGLCKHCQSNRHYLLIATSTHLGSGVLAVATEVVVYPGVPNSQGHAHKQEGQQQVPGADAHSPHEQHQAQRPGQDQVLNHSPALNRNVSSFSVDALISTSNMGAAPTQRAAAGTGAHQSLDNTRHTAHAKSGTETACQTHFNHN